jgi:hypothetical protein
MPEKMVNNSYAQNGATPPGGPFLRHKWSDINGNGARDQDEPGLAGVIIYLDENDNGEFDPEG